jgi:uncharacterized protein YdhG (YjbR/CyaY superfamily)
MVAEQGTVFTGVREKWLPLYRELLKMTEKAVGPFEEKPSSAVMAWRHTSNFAELGAKKDCLTVAFAAAALHDEWQPLKVTQTSKNRVVHHFEVTGGENFPALVERIKAAYDLTKAAKPLRRESGPEDYASIDEYIARFKPPRSDIMQKVRETMRRAAPEAVEKIAWQMPTFYQNGNLLHFAASKNHLGIYPGTEAMEAFADKIAGYGATKGSIHFPWDQPVPYGFIAEITRFCVERNRKR